MNWYLCLFLVFSNLSVLFGAYFIDDLLTKHRAQITANKVTLERANMRNCDIIMEDLTIGKEEAK